MTAGPDSPSAEHDQEDPSEDEAGREDPGARLSPNQLQALEALLGGESTVDAAEAAGVDRSTLWRWRQKDPDFQAAYNRHTDQLRQAVERDLQRGVEAAALAVETKIGEGDAELGFKLLQEMGMLDRGVMAAGPTDPDEIRREQRREEKRKLDFAVLQALFEAMPGPMEAAIETLGGSAKPPKPPRSSRPERSPEEEEETAEAEDPADGEGGDEGEDEA